MSARITVRTIAITGASSGIGAALARCYAGPGVHLILIARDASRLGDVAQDCIARGATARAAVADVTNQTTLSAALIDVNDPAPIALLIANAGILAGNPGKNDPENLRDTVAQIEINLLGAIHTVGAVIDSMIARGGGQIALTSSLAAFTPSPDWPGYCASKAALLSYGLSLRQRHAVLGIKVSVICPGWVTAPINDPYDMWRPYEISAEAAAKIIVKGLARNRAIVAFPARLAWPARLAMFLPPALQRIGVNMFRARQRAKE